MFKTMQGSSQMGQCLQSSSQNVRRVADHGRRKCGRVIAARQCHGSPAQGPEGRPFATSQSLQSLRRQKQSKTTEVNGASGYGADDVEAKIRNRKPPSLVQRVLAAFFYIVPWLDIVSIGYEYHRRFPTSIIFCVIPDPFFNIYYSSQFAPLIIFFLLFLSVVKNFKLHHFTRFHCMQVSQLHPCYKFRLSSITYLTMWCMTFDLRFLPFQAIVLDIVTMLFTLVRQYFPAEIRWSPVLGVYDMFAYNICICTIVYCIFFALAGRYANITYVSESTYMQVEEGS